MYDQTIDVILNDTTTHILDFVEKSPELSVYPTRVQVSSNDSLTPEYPVFVTAAQQKGVSSWELPLIVSTSHATLHFDEMARTLCPHDSGPNITSQSRPTLTLSTSSPKNLSVRIELRRVHDFYLEVNKEVNFSVTPSTPNYYYFSFDRDPLNLTHGQHSLRFPRFNYTIPKSVLLMIDSEDDVCAVVSIQNNSCPVFDNEEDVQYQGYHFTMTTRGGITVTQSMFPRGFYVVFIVKESDEECTGVPDNVHADKRIKRFSFMYRGVKPPSPTYHTVCTNRLVAVPSVSYSDYVTGALAALALVMLVALLAPVATALSCRSSEVLIIEDPLPSGSRSDTTASETAPMFNRSDESDLESEPEVEVEASLPVPLTLAGLSRAKPVAHDRRSNRYFWSALTVAVVYALPVVQLLITYQRVSAARRALGIPQHRGLLYSMALALFMEGLLSACYHLCPNKMNFQFDSSFMYVIAVLCIVKLYQSRHPDVNASAHTTFMLIACLMAIGLLGIMYPSLYFWWLFTVLHLAACFFLTLNIYYVGKLKMDRSLPYQAWSGLRTHGWSSFRVKYPARAALIAVANVANWALAGYGLYEHNKDFARHLLAILMGNAILYTLGYVFMKLLHRETVPLAAWLWLGAAHLTWAGAAVLFLSSRTKWSVSSTCPSSLQQTAAQSRTHNAVCSSLRVFDEHDLWHLSSAAAVFFSFNVLLVLDTPLDNTPRHLIPSF
ncbi:sid-1-related precursor 1 [Danaus plexippus plexippus]|uniref:Sid-1-related 1 n=1 Tax=Danaus plexippus plexippus TaxID=278856 RepID=A0A212F5T8_DANPL|nr:sid-1-related precursor 1 [Danaus plexippus plexippus]